MRETEEVERLRTEGDREVRDIHAHVGARQKDEQERQRSERDSKAKETEKPKIKRIECGARES